MPLNFTNFSTRLGKLFGYANSVETQVDALYNANLSSVLTTFDGTTYRPDVANLAPLSLPKSGLPSTVGASLYQQIQTSVNSFVIDAIRQEEGIYDGTLITALRAFYDAMVAQSKTYEQVGTSTATTTAATGNKGNGAIIVDQLRPAAVGITFTPPRQELFPETILGRCTVPGNANNFGQAVFQITGQTRYPSTNSEWPGGSGASTSITTTSAAVTSTVGTTGISMLTNGDFESWSTNTPQGWTITVGTAGTQVLQGTTPGRGSYALEIVGDGTTLTTLRQQIASSNGSPSQIQPGQHYAIACLARSNITGTGAVRIALRDAAGTVISPFIPINAATIGTSYVTRTASFSLDKSAIPTTLYLDIYSQTALAVGTTIMIDELVLVPMSDMYPGGPRCVIYPGTSDWAVDDYFTTAVVSDASVDGKFMKGFQRWLQTEAQGIFLPVSSTPTESDALVTV